MTVTPKLRISGIRRKMATFFRTKFLVAVIRKFGGFAHVVTNGWQELQRVQEATDVRSAV